MGLHILVKLFFAGACTRSNHYKHIADVWFMVAVCICARQWRVRGLFLLRCVLVLVLLLLLLLLVVVVVVVVVVVFVCFAQANPLLKLYSQYKYLGNFRAGSSGSTRAYDVLYSFNLTDLDGRKTITQWHNSLVPRAFRLRELCLLTPSFVESTPCRIWRILSWALLQVDPQSAIL